MVEINNNLRGINDPVVDAYLRNLNEYRAGVENSILPLISYFVDMTESQQNTVKLPSSIFEDQKDYLIRLAKRYHKRKFDVIVNHKHPLKVYDFMTNLIKNNCKAVQYSLCDLIDFMFTHKSIFEDVEISYNLAKAVQEETVDYHHEHSKELDNIIKESEENMPKKTIYTSTDITYPTFTKFASPQHVYLFMLDHMKRAIDFEMLKFYDFIREYAPLTIQSNKLKGIEEDLKRRGEGEYTKEPLDIDIRPHIKGHIRSVDDIFFGQWAANIQRGLKAQKLMAHDFINYMKLEEGEKAKELYLTGTYPDLISLLHHFFKGDFPQDLKPNF